ncbi:MAG: TIGR04076 family protein [Candidatus Thorarchaeota archaeon]|nr:TIGR04076 family protein [Candidatus Thorarchaeota archaeon]
MPWHRLEIEVVNILESGTCNHGHKVGDKFSTTDDCRGICTAAYHSLYPYIVAMRSGGSFPWDKDPDVTEICCPDPKNPVVFKITRKEDME